MLLSCIVCRAEASPDLPLLYCTVCQSALYCSKACQTIDWRKQHKQICKHIIHEEMQVRTNIHTSRLIESKEDFEGGDDSLNEDGRRFLQLFTESTREGSRAAEREMKEIAARQTTYNQMFMIFHSLHILARSDSEMLSWPNSPLLVMLQFVSPNVLYGDEDEPLEGETRGTLLHDVSLLADPMVHLTHENQRILAKQLIEHGANVNAVSSPYGKTPLHYACFAAFVTNLDFIELLLEAGADPNAQDHLGMTPLMNTTPVVPGAAKFLLNWPTTDVNPSWPGFVTMWSIFPTKFYALTTPTRSTFNVYLRNCVKAKRCS
jgi:hypothetical protein